MITITIQTADLKEVFNRKDAILNAGNGDIPFNNLTGYCKLVPHGKQYGKDNKFFNLYDFNFYSKEGELIYSGLGGMV